MDSSKKPVQLKVFVDKEKKKVMFAEAEEDFVEVLFSFFTLPLGTIARLSRKYSKDAKVGSLTSLYESVVNLDVKHFLTSNWNWKDFLVNPSSSSSTFCQQLKVNLDETVSNQYSFPNGMVSNSNRYSYPNGMWSNSNKYSYPNGMVSNHYSYGGNSMFVKSKANFIITDDLNVVPVMLDTSIVFLTSLGVENINLLEERSIYFGVEEFLNLLKWSLYTDNPLTNLVFGGSVPCSSSVTKIKQEIKQEADMCTSKSGQTQTVKLMVQKSNKKVLCAQVERPFVELLFSFLTIPLGAFIRLTMDNPYPFGIYNLYKSISCLADEKHLKSEDVKTMLLSPKLASKYPRVTDYLPIYEVNTKPGHFLNEHETFMVSNDLQVTAYPSMTTISKFNTLGIPVGDMEVVEVSIGEQEALSILKASLTSTSALSDCLNAFSKNAFSKKRKYNDLKHKLESDIFIVLDD